MPKVLPSIDYLRECFIYDIETGELRWKARPREHFATAWMWSSWNTRFAGRSAGCVDSKGHLKVHVDYRRYQLHRLVWKLMTGEEPPASIDHKDTDRAANRWDNLRPATRAKQKWNSGVQKNNTSGFRGVSFDRGKYRARADADGAIRYLGRFDTAEEAGAAADAARRELHGEFYREAGQL